MNTRATNHICLQTGSLPRHPCARGRYPTTKIRALAPVWQGPYRGFRELQGTLQIRQAAPPHHWAKVQPTSRNFRFVSPVCEFIGLDDAHQPQLQPQSNRPASPRRLRSETPPTVTNPAAMASRTSMRLFRAAHCAAPCRPYRPQAHCHLMPRFYSTGADDVPPPPPFLGTLKGELKTAMRAKDGPRLAVLRAIISANLNASKTKQPIRTDVQLVKAITRMRRTAEDSAAEAKAAGREDLVEKSLEEAQLLAEYEKLSGVETVSEEEMRPIVAREIEISIKEGDQKKTLVADVMHHVRAAFEGKNFDNKALAEMVKNMIKEKNNAALKAKMGEELAAKIGVK